MGKAGARAKGSQLFLSQLPPVKGEKQGGGKIRQTVPGNLRYSVVGAPWHSPGN